MIFGDGGTGNVGVGSGTPSEKLDVNGNIKASGSIISSSRSEERRVGKEC